MTFNPVSQWKFHIFNHGDNTFRFGIVFTSGPKGHGFMFGIGYYLGYIGWDNELNQSKG